MNILVIGNGFDLAHGLPTGYPDFLAFCKMIKAVYTIDNNCNADKIWAELGIKLKNDTNTERLKIKFSELYSMTVAQKDEDRDCVTRTNTVFDELLGNIENNFWIEYLEQNPMYQRTNWIDFENEISNVIQSLDNDMFDKDGIKYQFTDEIETYLSNEFLEEYFDTHPFVVQCDDFGEKSNGISFKSIRDILYKDLNRTQLQNETQFCIPKCSFVI